MSWWLFTLSFTFASVASRLAHAQRRCLRRPQLFVRVEVLLFLRCLVTSPLPTLLLVVYSTHNTLSC
jgi:hypothetical protein